MEDKIPYIAHESDMARMERVNKRLWIALLLSIAIATISNGLWLYRESQFEDTQTIITQDNADGYNNYIGNDGDIVNGKTNDSN